VCGRAGALSLTGTAGGRARNRRITAEGDPSRLAILWKNTHSAHFRMGTHWKGAPHRPSGGGSAFRSRAPPGPLAATLSGGSSLQKDWRVLLGQVLVGRARSCWLRRKPTKTPPTILSIRAWLGEKEVPRRDSIPRGPFALVISHDQADFLDQNVGGTPHPSDVELYGKPSLPTTATLAAFFFCRQEGRRQSARRGKKGRGSRAWGGGRSSPTKAGAFVDPLRPAKATRPKARRRAALKGRSAHRWSRRLKRQKLAGPARCCFSLRGPAAYSKWASRCLLCSRWAGPVQGGLWGAGETTRLLRDMSFNSFRRGEERRRLVIGPQRPASWKVALIKNFGTDHVEADGGPRGQVGAREEVRHRL